jgi:hypothetical protein
VVGLNRLMGPNLPLLNNSISNGKNKPVQIHFYSQRSHTIIKMNDNINMDVNLHRFVFSVGYTIIKKGKVGTH